MSYRCNNCGYETNKFFALCPKCKDGIGEETLEPYGNKNAHKMQNSLNISKKIKNVDRNAKAMEASRFTQYQNFNNVIGSSKGFVDGQVVLMGANPGVGKSTLCTAISADDTLYISSEENYYQVNARFLRVNHDANCDILNSTSFEEICEAIRTTDKKLVIIDSINSIDFGVGYATTARYAAEITNIIKELDKICIIISQVTKSGEITGMQSLIHVVDTVLHLERSETSSNIIATSSKNRYGAIGEVAVFEHHSNGFSEIDVDFMHIKSEIGATYTTTRFGHKNMTIAIEALVSTAQSAYGLRSVNGYSKSRLVQLIGILSYFGKMDLSNKDIYVALSNGLSTDDISVELAMANSILSSFYHKAVVKEAYGEIRLNGKINHGTIDGQQINHINDLINMYRG